MSPSQIVVLGAVAGLTIYLGLPLGRLRAPAPRVKTFMSAAAVGILLFLFWDVLSNAWDPVTAALGAHHYPAAAGYAAVMLACAGASLLGLVYFDRWMTRRMRAARPEGPGAATARQVSGRRAQARGPGQVAPAGGPGRATVAAGARPAPGDARARALQLSMLIAVGIGMHNFGEGLAIGTSAAAGRISLAILLVIGFGAHNATEGFGIVGPMAGAGERPGWGRLALLGLIGGGPTFLGTIVGEQVTAPVLGVAFLALAAGSILYVVIELLAVVRASGFKTVVTWAILTGLALGFITDAIVTAAGA